LKIDSNGEFVIEPYGGPMQMCSECINHGIGIPSNKTFLEIGLYTNAYIFTEKGNKIEVAIRKMDSFHVPLVSRNANTYPDSLPIRVFPECEESTQKLIPNNFFNPYYNCHGCTLVNDTFWINPYKDNVNQEGQIISDAKYRNLVKR